MNKRVGIITMIGLNNYGNRLQNYALQETLKRLGYDCYTLYNREYCNNRKFFVLRNIKHFLKKNKSINKNREKHFIEFNEKFIQFYNKRITAYSSLKNFDYLISGSDQVWNPYMGGLRDLDTQNMRTKAKKISYAASFGISSLEKKHEKIILKNISKFQAISVRELQGKKLLENILKNKKIEVLVDPTLLLSKQDWEQIMQQPKAFTNKKYILNYFLGEISPTVKKEINQIAEKYHCDIINLLDQTDPFYECGPSEFLFLEKNAFLICTDSFHSSLFAFLFDVPFIVFDRKQQNLKNINSRIETLINTFKLENREYDGESIKDKNIKHDYKKSYEILKIEIEKSLKFLKNALDCENKKYE